MRDQPGPALPRTPPVAACRTTRSGSSTRSSPSTRATPLVTVLDGHPHTLAFLRTIQNVPVGTLGVTRFGQSGAIEDVYRYHRIDTDSIVITALDLIH